MPLGYKVSGKLRSQFTSSYCCIWSTLKVCKHHVATTSIAVVRTCRSFLII